MRRHILVRPVVVLLMVAIAINLFVDTARAQVPPIPAVFSGTATIAGQAVPDGQFIVGKVGSYLSEPAVVTDGFYDLVVAPQDPTLISKKLVFIFDIPRHQLISNLFVKIKIWSHILYQTNGCEKQLTDVRSKILYKLRNRRLSSESFYRFNHPGYVFICL